MLKLTSAQEDKIRNHIIQVIRDETQNKYFKAMYCCRRITGPVVLKMNNSVTKRQVFRVLQKMASEGFILISKGEPPQVMLQEYYDEMYKDRNTFCVEAGDIRKNTSQWGVIKFIIGIVLAVLAIFLFSYK